MSNEPPDNFLDAILNDVIGITTPFQRKQGRSELAALRAERDAQAKTIAEAQMKLSRMTDWCQYWLLAARQISGSNDGHVLRDDINSCRAWLAAHPTAPRASGARGQFSERDADAYALRMLRKWRREH